jgi:hypothetical protein
MSDFHAIGGVSETLRSLLLDRMEVPEGLGAPLEVTIGMPKSDVVDPTKAAETPRVNLFLYRVVENGWLKNQEIPGRGTTTAYGHPPLSLDLHYLVTAYGTRDGKPGFQETLAHFLLGGAMRVFHDHAIVTEDLLTVRDPVGTPILHDSLIGEFEKVKTALEPVSLEDLSKVWTALTQPYRVSATYHVSVVQVESRRQRQFPRRVKEPPNSGARIFVVPFRYPRIQEIAVVWQDDPTVEKPYPYARVLDTLILKGTNLGSAQTVIKMGGLEILVGLTQNSRIEVLVPDNLLPDGTPILPDKQLQPGAQTVEVMLGVPELPAAGFPSNQAVFMLTPRVIPPPVANLGVTPRTLTLNGTRLFHPNLRSETIVGGATIPSSAYTTSTATQIAMPLPDTLVAWPAAAYVSGAGIVFPIGAALPFDMNVTIGAEGPRLVHVPRKPVDLADAAALLQAALRISTMGMTLPGPAFQGARVTFTTDGRLIIVPGQLAGAITVANAVVGSGVSEAFNLTGATGAAQAQVFLSGELLPFPTMRMMKPQVRLTIGATTHDIALLGKPTELAEVISWLELGIRSFADPAFANARVAALGNQVLLLPGAAGAVQFTAASPNDTSSVFELDLAKSTAIRVRVNGAESVAETFVDLTA